MYRAYLRVTKHGLKLAARKSPFNLNTMPQRFPRIVSNLLSTERNTRCNTASAWRMRAATRAERHGASSASLCSPLVETSTRNSARGYVQTNNGSTRPWVRENIYSRRLLLSARSGNVPARADFVGIESYARNSQRIQSHGPCVRLLRRATKRPLHRSYLIETQHPAGYPSINLVSLSGIFTAAPRKPAV